MRSCWRGFRKKTLPPIAAFFAKYLIKGIVRTCKVETIGLEKYLEHVNQEKCLLALWHNRLAPTIAVMETHTPFDYSAVISNSRDGALLTAIINSHKRGSVIKVVHTARHQALKQIIHELRKNEKVVVITPDGPRGPAYEVKPGLIAAARLSGANIIPINWEGNSFWELNSWDRFRVPKPFSTLTFHFGEPIAVDRRSPLSDEELCRQLKEKMMNPGS